jgi:hypothetical protein
VDEVRILATCSLGLGFSASGFRAGLAEQPHLIACDAGSSDFGPFYLGSGKVQKAWGAVKRDMSLLIQGARSLDIPFITGSVGGAGGEPHVTSCVEMVREIAREDDLHFRLASISAAMSKGLLRSRLREGRMRPVGDVPSLTEERIEGLSAAVGMMGVEPFMAALDGGAQMVVAGRATDPSIFASVPLRAGLPAGLAWHAAKCIDKGYLATTKPQDGSPVIARITEDGFTVEPTRQASGCTIATVAGITLHENPDPYRVAQPTGVINTIDAVYEQIDARRVRVSGSRYDPTPPTIKIEGAELVGYRHILIAGLRDPRLIERIDEFLDAYRQRLERTAHSLGILPEDYTLQFRVYGKDAVMGAYEAVLHTTAHELGLVVDLVAKTPEISAAMATRLGPTGSRLDITGKLGGGGNFAYPFSPSLINVGPAYEWSVWHLMDVSQDELTSLFPVTFHDL